MRTRILVALAVCGATWLALTITTPASLADSAPAQWSSVIEGVGVGEILINKSSRNDVIAKHGRSFKLINHNEYSLEMDYGPVGLTFYYCAKDRAQKIFLIELHKGMTSTGIQIGQSTLKDVFDVYRPQDNGCTEAPCEYDYPGIQFYLEPDAKAGDQGADRMKWKVVEADIVASDTSSNFCDAYEQ